MAKRKSTMPPAVLAGRRVVERLNAYAAAQVTLIEDGSEESEREVDLRRRALEAARDAFLDTLERHPVALIDPTTEPDRLFGLGFLVERAALRRAAGLSADTIPPDVKAIESEVDEFDTCRRSTRLAELVGDVETRQLIAGVVAARPGYDPLGPDPFDPPELSATTAVSALLAMVAAAEHALGHVQEGEQVPAGDEEYLAERVLVAAHAFEALDDADFAGLAMPWSPQWQLARRATLAAHPDPELATRTASELSLAFEAGVSGLQDLLEPTELDDSVAIAEETRYRLRSMPAALRWSLPDRLDRLATDIPFLAFALGAWFRGLPEDEADSPMPWTAEWNRGLSRDD
jgi:hypothetical protein